MSLQLDQVARLPDAAVLPHGHPRRQAALAALLLSLAAVVLLYHATFWSMAELWARSQTFAHGFLIVPISCWLAWRQRARLAALAPRPSRQGLLLLGVLGLTWLLADAANVPVVEQYAATAMLPACVLAVLGWPAVRLLAFPLAYLFLAVPFGEVFIEPLIDFTAAFTVTALQWSGVPVFRDGSNFSLPTGNWSVVEACSGLRYLIAALALGALFAHVNCHSTRRRVAVMAAALLVPILANGVRAYLIVMLGHLSDMRLAVGVDHLIYGWLFFGLVALLLFWLAARWRELPPPRAVPSGQPVRLSAGAASPRTAVRAGVACLLLAAVWPALALASQRDDGATLPAMVLALPDPPAWRRLHDAVPDWQAPYAGTPARFAATYARHDGDGTPVGLQLHWYARQARDAELLTHQALPYGARWMPLAQRVRHVKLAGGALAVRESVLAYGGERLLVWRVYRQGGIVTARPVLVKLLLAQAKLLGRRQDGADIIVFAAYDELAPPPRARLQAFLQAALPVIEQRLQELPHGP
ncbi:exosortase A [Janthinobacterium lividum]|uniref:exosortase A n=1 Tax=Janthinobacterium lividum TaxID=29581 RepID=UPI00044C5D3A|nr:exosortase A [Janthinobacterium lividum]EZP41101.1 Eight transmembrane protein EpsH [Janthinobacterium lividum]